MRFSINHLIFNHIKKSHQSVKLNNLTLLYEFCENACLGFVVPRAMGSSVKRNLFKRRCRNAFVQLYQEESFPIVGVLVRPKTINMNYKKISSAFKALSNIAITKNL